VGATQATTGSGTDGSSGGAGKGRILVLAAMIFAVSMTFIDMTIVSIAIPELQQDLHLSSTGVQWVVNAYLLSLAALFAFGGRVGDVLGHKRMVLLGVVIFATASALNGLTPTGGAAEAWIITFRAVQGLGAALMFPAALAIVVSTFPFAERGRAMAVFFAVAGGLTAVGPLLGGVLSEWTWRSIFWVNIPVAIIAVVLTLMSKPIDTYQRARIDVVGLVLITAGMALAILGLQQASDWGWENPLTWACIVVGLALLVVFFVVERRIEVPLINVAIFKVRAFFVENAVLFVTMIVFIPIFFFASMYAQIALGMSASNAGLYLLTFFAGFAPAAQIGGRILDQRGAKPAVVLGAVVSAVGFYLWATKATDLDGGLGAQWWTIVLAGAGMGLLVGPSNTDAINRASGSSYGEATGVTQTVRNFGSALGMAVLGSVLIAANRSNIESTLGGFGVDKSSADQIAQSLSQSGGGSSSSFGGGQIPAADQQKVFEAVQGDFAQSIQLILYCMAGVMAVAAVIALVGLQRGKQEAPVEDPTGSPAPA
jgi:EmrB/QacA subfamily drug resistance transporter